MEQIENGEFQSIPNAEKRKKELIHTMKNSFSKGTQVNIQISEFDLNRLKAKASEEGIPYQTLIGNVIHKYATGKLEAVKK